MKETRTCQCCGTKHSEEDCGRNPDGSMSEYCKACYEHGELKYSSMDGVIGNLLQFTRASTNDENAVEEERIRLNALLPTLALWNLQRNTFM